MKANLTAKDGELVVKLTPPSFLMPVDLFDGETSENLTSQVNQENCSDWRSSGVNIRYP